MQSVTVNQVVIYTNASCVCNPGQGGYAARILNHGSYTEISAGYQKTTNNRMELKAVVEALRKLAPKSLVTLYSVSQYVVHGISKGQVRSWQGAGWYNDGKPVRNADLWRELLSLCQSHDVNFVWIKGQTDHPENKRCHALAIEAAQGSKLLVDEEYVNAKVPDPLQGCLF